MANVLLALLEALMPARDAALVNVTESKTIEVEGMAVNCCWLFDLLS